MSKKIVNTICEKFNGLFLIKIKLLIATDQVSEIILNIEANIYTHFIDIVSSILVTAL